MSMNTTTANLEDITDFDIVKSSLDKIRNKIGVSESLELLPYIISIEGIDENYFMGTSKWEFESRFHTRDVHNDPLKGYALIGSGIVIPKMNPKRLYGQIIGNKPHESKLLANRIINVPNHPYGNYSRSLRLQLDPVSSYRAKIPTELSFKIRNGSSISLVQLNPSDLEQKANEYN
jgi:hypothetical protein